MEAHTIDHTLACCVLNGCPVQLVKILLNQGADPNSTVYLRYGVLLYYAALDGNIEAVKLLLDYGADPNVNLTGTLHETALEAAHQRSHAEIAKLLLSHGACYEGMELIKAEAILSN